MENNNNNPFKNPKYAKLIKKAFIYETTNFNNEFIEDGSIDTVKLLFVNIIGSVNTMDLDETEVFLQQDSYSNAGVITNYEPEIIKIIVDIQDITNVVFDFKNKQYFLSYEDFSDQAWDPAVERELKVFDFDGKKMFKIQSQLSSKKQVEWIEMDIFRADTIALDNQTLHFVYGEPPTTELYKQEVFIDPQNTNSYSSKSFFFSQTHNSAELSCVKFWGHESKYESKLTQFTPNYVDDSNDNLFILWSHARGVQGKEITMASEWMAKGFHNFILNIEASAPTPFTIGFPQTPGVDINQGIFSSADEYNIMYNAWRLFDFDYGGRTPGLFDLTVGDWNPIEKTLTLKEDYKGFREQWKDSFIAAKVLTGNGIVVVRDNNSSLLLLDGFTTIYELMNNKEDVIVPFEKVNYGTTHRSLGSKLPGPFAIVNTITSLFGGGAEDQFAGFSEYAIGDGESNLFYHITCWGKDLIRFLTAPNINEGQLRSSLEFQMWAVQNLNDFVELPGTLGGSQGTYNRETLKTLRDQERIRFDISVEFKDWTQPTSIRTLLEGLAVRNFGDWELGQQDSQPIVRAIEVSGHYYKDDFTLFGNDYSYNRSGNKVDTTKPIMILNKNIKPRVINYNRQKILITW